MRNYSSIKELVIATCTKDGRFPSYEKLTALVLEHFPRSGWQESHYLWYKAKIKSREIIIPRMMPIEERPSQMPALNIALAELASNTDNSEEFPSFEEIVAEFQAKKDLQLEEASIHPVDDQLIDNISLEPVTLEKLPKKLNHSELEYSIETSLSLDRDLRSYLTNTVTDIEANLTLEPDGIEYPTEAGNIDLLARDETGQLVVVELLVGKAKDSALGQLLGYIGFISEQNNSSNVRGILVASEFDKPVIYAAKALPQIKLVKYSIAFKLEEVC